MSCSAEFNGWCIITGVDFRQVFFVKDPTLPQIDNPEYDSLLPESINNRKLIYQPKDLTGYTAEMDIREGEERGSSALAELSLGSGITIDELLGSVELFIDNSVTNTDPILAFAGNDSFYDIFLIPPAAGDTELPLFGKIPIRGTTTDV